MHRQTFEHIWLPILFSQNLSPSCLTILGIVPCQFYSLDFQDKIEKIGNIPPKLYSSLSGMYSSRRTVIIAQPKIFIVANQRTNLVPQSPVLMTLQSRQVRVSGLVGFLFSLGKLSSVFGHDECFTTSFSQPPFFRGALWCLNVNFY